MGWQSRNWSLNKGNPFRYPSFLNMSVQWGKGNQGKFQLTKGWYSVSFYPRRDEESQCVCPWSFCQLPVPTRTEVQNTSPTRTCSKHEMIRRLRPVLVSEKKGFFCSTYGFVGRIPASDSTPIGHVHGCVVRDMLVVLQMQHKLLSTHLQPQLKLILCAVIICRVPDTQMSQCCKRER